MLLQFNGLHQYLTPNMYKVMKKKTVDEKFKTKNSIHMDENDDNGLKLQKLIDHKM